MQSDIPTSHRAEVFPPWHFDRWRAVDDRVRGGSSTSNMDPIDQAVVSGVERQGTLSEKGEKAHAARFWGHLDISTLGGAGFASQTYTFAPTPLHLSRVKYDGLRLRISADPHIKDDAASPETFTLVLKNTIRTKPPKEPKLPPQPEPAVLTYEAPFKRPLASAGSAAQGSRTKVQSVDIAWTEFKPHYRGREVPRDDERWKPLDTDGIYEISFMCRSGFGKQHGDFGVVIESLAGVEKGNSRMGLACVDGFKLASWRHWLGDWWAWLASRFVGGGRVRLDEKV